VAQSVDIKELERLDFFPTSDDDDLATIEAPEAVDRDSCSVEDKDKDKHVSMWVELAALIKRDLSGIRRNPMILGARLMLSGFMSILAGLIFWQVGGKVANTPIVSSRSML